MRSRHALPPFDRMLLSAALSGSAASWAALGAALQEPGGLDQLSGERQDLIGLLHRAASAAGEGGELAARLRGGHRRTWAANGLRLAGLRTASAGLTRAGVPYLVADDLGILAMLGDLGARPLERLRLIVPPDAAAPARESLARAGWTPRPVARGTYVADAHAGAWEHRDGERLELTWSLGADLQPRPTRNGPALPSDDEVLWAAAQPADLAGIGEVLRLGDVHQLVRLAAAPDGWLPRPRLLRLADLVLVGNHAGLEGWRAFGEEARQRERVPTMTSRLSYAAAIIPGAIPPAVLAGLRDEPFRRRDRLAELTAPISPALARHLRATRDAPLADVLVGLPASLRSSWNLPSAWQTPLIASRRAVERTMRRR